MPLRYQPPVFSRVSARALARAAVAGVARGDMAVDRLAAALTLQYSARAVALTDSGTSALVLALGALAPAGSTVALPAYACVDLIAAAVRANVRVRLYDIDPATLGPDLDSLRRALERGAQVVVVAHLYGYPADVPAVRALADAAGPRVIEDAAQHAGGRLADVRLGAFGPLTVLSFGRGKGLTGGRGGALLATAAADTEIANAVAGMMPRPEAGGRHRSESGWGDLARAAAQWVFGRPMLYGIPASIPMLRLGETIYRPAHQPAGLSRPAATLVEDALVRMDADRLVRAHRARWYVERLSDLSATRLVAPIPGAEPGYLRLPLLDNVSGSRAHPTAPPLGIVRTYPRPLGDEPALAAMLHAREPATPGARELCTLLLTLPTHARVTDPDGRAVVDWVRIPKNDRQHH